MAIRALSKATLAQRSASIQTARANNVAERGQTRAVDRRYIFKCGLALGLVIAAFFVCLHLIRVQDEPVIPACYDRARASYLKGSYIAAQLTYTCLQYGDSGRDQQRLLISGLPAS